jgi:amino acid transporter
MDSRSLRLSPLPTIDRQARSNHLRRPKTKSACAPGARLDHLRHNKALRHVSTFIAQSAMSANACPTASWVVPKKLAVYLLFVVLAIVVSGLYGILHNQISYTVSPEYFTRFKFRQFGLVDTPLPERVRASLVGFLASWWLGIPIGLLIGAAGFIHRGAGQMFRVSLWSILVAVAFTLLFGLGGLLYGDIQTADIDLDDYRGWFIPDDVVDVRRFLCAGYMHNSSYLGGVLAVLVAWAFHGLCRGRERGAA